MNDLRKIDGQCDSRVSLSVHVVVQLSATTTMAMKFGVEVLALKPETCTIANDESLPFIFYITYQFVDIVSYFRGK